jgi:hypothetical protein
MSSKQDNSLAIGIAFIGMAAMAVWVFFAVAATFITFVMTILSLKAWNKRFQLEPWSIEPQEARGFIKRGLAGAVLVPIFAAICLSMAGVRVVDTHLILAAVAGFVGGSLGIAYLMHKAAAESAEVPPPSVPVPVKQPEEIEAKASNVVPFRFASWKDEELHK